MTINTAGTCLVFSDYNLGGIDFGSGANIDDLFTGDCTIEFYARKESGEIYGAYFLTKTDGANGWYMYLHADGTIRYLAYFAGNNLNGLSANTFNDNQPHHIAFDFTFATLTGRLFVDGVLESSDTAAGAYVSDSDKKCICNGIGEVDTSEDKMTIGWIRLSNTRRYTGASFDPPSRFRPPGNDANAQLLIYMNEGDGTTAADYSGNGYDGAITFGATTHWSTWWGSRGATWLHLAGVHEEA